MSEKDIDFELILAARAGDNEAFDVLVLKYQHKLHRMLLSHVHDPVLAKDIAQDSFIAAYRALSTFKGDSGFYTWLFRIAINVAYHYQSHIEKGETPVSLYADEDTPERLLATDELRDAIIAAVNELPDELQQCMVLREIAGLSYDKIAELIQCPIGTVRSRIHRAREEVEDKLKPYLD